MNEVVLISNKLQTDLSMMKEAPFLLMRSIIFFLLGIILIRKLNNRFLNRLIKMGIERVRLMSFL